MNWKLALLGLCTVCVISAQADEPQEGKKETQTASAGESSGSEDEGCKECS